MNRTHLARLLCGAAFVVVATVAASASAAGIKSEIDVPGGGFVSVGTDCPRNTALVSQGFGTKGFTVDGPGGTVVRIDSHRSGTGLASGAQNFGTAQGVFDAYAYCSKAGRNIRVVRSKEFVAAGTFGTARATCPRGRVPVGGGFGAPGFAGSTVQAITLTSRRQGRAWQVEALAQGGGATARGGIGMSGRLVAYAYCMKNAPKITVRKQSVTVDQAGLKTAVGTCPKGREAISGGFDGDIRLSGTPQASGVVVSRRAMHGRAWKGRAISVNETGGATATIYAYCIKS